MRSAKPWCRWGSLVIIMGILIGAFVSSGAKSEATGVRHRINIQHFKFAPANLVVEPGDTVVWVNLDIVPHTITAKDNGWDSQTLQTNDVWELDITEEMTGAYFCRFHPAMVGRLQVKLN